MTDPQIVLAGNGMTALDAALTYAARGWAVFPVPPGTKMSHKSMQLNGGRRWGATTDPAEIRRDWVRWPNAGVGIPTGIDAGFFVIEADTVAGHGVDGLAGLRALEAINGPLPTTLMAMSPSGSVHRYYKHPGNGVKVKSSNSEIAPGVDVKGDGGMVVGPPTVRADGAYKWINDLPIAEAPAWLIKLVKDKPRPPPERNCATASDDRGFCEYDVAEARAALAVIDPDLARSDWIAIACALFNGFGEDGFELWDEWSSRGGKYPGARDIQYQWHSIARAGGYNFTIATVFHFANEANLGWRGPLDEEMRARERIANAPENIAWWTAYFSTGRPPCTK